MNSSKLIRYRVIVTVGITRLYRSTDYNHLTGSYISFMDYNDRHLVSRWTQQMLFAISTNRLRRLSPKKVRRHLTDVCPGTSTQNLYSEVLIFGLLPVKLPMK